VNRTGAFGCCFPIRISLDLSATYGGMMIAIPEPHWEIFRTLPQRANYTDQHGCANSPPVLVIRAIREIRGFLSI
jgi:hypothetical protein